MNCLRLNTGISIDIFFEEFLSIIYIALRIKFFELNIVNIRNLTKFVINVPKF